MLFAESNSLQDCQIVTSVRSYHLQQYHLNVWLESSMYFAIVLD